MSEAAITSLLDDTPGQPSIRGFLHLPPNPTGAGLVLTHSAGGNSQAPLLIALAHSFSAAGITVLRCDLPFRQRRPHGPPLRGSAQADQEGLRRCLELLRNRLPGPFFLGGHSYGGRQGTMLAASEPNLSEALLLLSYPLHPPKQASKPRTAHFPDLRTPALFVHGTRDPFGSIAEMQSALALIPARTRLVTIEGAGHELVSKRNRGDFASRVLDAFVAFFAPDK